MKLAEAEKIVAAMLASGMPVAPHERHAAVCRPVEQRVPWPKAGDAVWYRHNPHGPLTGAIVQEVDVSNKDDQYVWEYVLDPMGGGPVTVNGVRLRQMVDDPWPDVYLQTDWGRIVTREARIEGSPGWLPMKAGE